MMTSSFDLDGVTRDRCMRALHSGRLFKPVRSAHQDKHKTLKLTLLSSSRYSIPVFDANNAHGYMAGARQHAMHEAGDFGRSGDVPEDNRKTVRLQITQVLPQEMCIPFELRVSKYRRPLRSAATTKKIAYENAADANTQANSQAIRSVLVVCPKLPRIVELLQPRASLCMRDITMGDQTLMGSKRIIPLTQGELIPGLYVTLTVNSGKQLTFTYCICLTDGRVLAADVEHAKRTIDADREVYYNVPKLHPTTLLEDILRLPKIIVAEGDNDFTQNTDDILKTLTEAKPEIESCEIVENEIIKVEVLQPVCNEKDAKRKTRPNFFRRLLRLFKRLILRRRS